MKKIFTLGSVFALLWIMVANMNAQDVQNPWHLITFENEEEVAFYNIEMITGIEVKEQNITVALDNEKEFSHPLATTTFGFDPRQAGNGTPNENISAPEWSVRYANGRLYFSEPVNGIAVYTLTGTAIARFTGSYSEMMVNLQTGIYLIQAGGKSAKLLVSNGNGSTTAQPAIEIKPAGFTPLHGDGASEPGQKPPARIGLRADEAIKAYWNITTGNTTTAIEVSHVEKFYFTSGNSILITMKEGYSIEFTDYLGGEFSVEPVDILEETPPAEPIVLTVRQLEKVSADNRFAFKMFQEVSSMNGSNTFFSPLSLNMALGMLFNGASGDTRSEMAEVLGMADFTDLEINEYYQKMSQSLLNIDPLTELGIANSIWYRTGFSVKQSFIDINQNYFDAIVKALDFSEPDAADIINQWCAEKTNDRIKEIVDNPIPENVMMHLINALYFKSKWKFEFDKTLTKQDDFTTADSRKVTVNMMEQLCVSHYYTDPYLQCVEMPYGNEAFSMIVVLPGNSMDIDQLVDYLDDKMWQNIVDNLWKTNVYLKLPRFKIECDLPLNDPVINVGMKRIFGGGFSNISDAPLQVSKIKQKTFVEVNEAGTEAAAVTDIEMFVSADPGLPNFVANRPFLYLIKEKSTGTILFIGRMDEPKE